MSQNDEKKLSDIPTTKRELFALFMMMANRIASPEAGPERIAEKAKKDADEFMREMGET